MKRRADLLIVGGGPAGLTLAILARTMGFSVGLVEAVAFPRTAHGDTLPAGIESYFDLLGIARERVYRDAVPFQFQHLRWEGPEVAITKMGDLSAEVPTQGLHIPRHRLDLMLQERALEVGVEILQPCVVKDIVVLHQRIAGFKTNKGTFLGELVVDAAGSRHWLARKLEMPVYFCSPRLYGYYNWARGRGCPDCFDHPFVYAEERGWTWISRVEAELYQVTRQTFEPIPDASLWLPPEFIRAGLVAIGPTRGADLTWRIVARAAGRGFAMIGDAVRRSDPMTQRGIERGMADACKLSALIVRWKNGELSEDEWTTAYADEVKADYVKGLQAAYGFLRCHPQAPSWLRQETMYYKEVVLNSSL